MARIISERLWHSSKVSNIQPKEWRPEYAWLVAIAFVDGTFEADPQEIWARAYAYSRPDWNAEKVVQLLDEFERVGLLQRIKDKDGRVWGFWTGSDNFTPPPSKRNHYRAGKRSLFSLGANNGETLCTQGEAAVQTGGTPAVLLSSETLTLGLTETLTLTQTQCLKDDQEPDQPQGQQQKRGVSGVVSLEATPITAEATPKAARRRPVLSADEYDRQQVEQAVAELAAEMAAKK